MKIAILGHFAENKNFCDGQTVKTRELFNAFKMFSDYSISKIDTYNWKKHPFNLILQIRRAIKSCETLIILPAKNGVQVFVPLINLFNKKHKCKIFYSVIGAWLGKLVKQKGDKFIKQLSKLNGIWAETNNLKVELENLGLKNVKIIENFKNLNPAYLDKTSIYNNEIKNFCIFSRIIKEKGISIAINAIAEINADCDKNVAKLDIYGPIGKDYKQEFFDLVNKYSQFVEYKGVVNSSESVSMLSNYYCLLFPTFFKGEGVPGTIIDAFFAGVPIIASEWQSCRDILDGNCAIIYDFDRKQAGLKESLYKMLDISKSNYTAMSNCCLGKAELYKVENVMNKIFNEIL